MRGYSPRKQLSSIPATVVAINSTQQLPLTVGVMHFFEGVHVNWGLMMASAVMMTLPLAILFMVIQRHLVAGFGAGAVKG